MKEATGELNMTVVTVVAIAAIAAFFYAFVWPAIQRNITQSTNCSNALNCVCDGGNCQCQYYDENMKLQDITCPDQSNAGTK